MEYCDSILDPRARIPHGLDEASGQGVTLGLGS